jgi:hypothetical protein
VTGVTDGLGSILPSAAILGLFALVAGALSLARAPAEEDGPRTRDAVRASAAAVVAQGAHFAEELVTGFPERFPALFGLGPMPLWFFVSFNVAWLVVWSLCARGLAGGGRAVLFPLWFLGIGCVGNGVAHPSFSVLAGGYFPGLVTSPVVAFLGVALLRSLARVTRVEAQS